MSVMPTSMPKLMLTPFRDGYNFSLARNVVTTETDGGMPRTRKDSIGKPHRANPTYKCTRAQWQYFLTFMRVYEGLPFLAYLLLDDVDHQWYECDILDMVLPVSSLGDQIFTVQLSLVAKPIKYDVESDITFLDVYKMTDGQVEQYFTLLEKLVNEDLPSATRGL